jgi:hypothetical protein
VSARLGRGLAALATIASSISASHLAHAQDRNQGVDEFGGYGSRRGVQSQSKQEAAFELRFGRYVPEVDSQLDSSPFADTFGGDHRYMFGAEVDWQVLRIPHFGTLAPGIGWGYTKFSAKAKYADGSGVSSSSTRLSIMPMYLVGVVRADVIPRELKVPLVPYAKLGVGYGLWWSSDGKRTAEINGKVARGASYGLTYALGAMFLLDVLDEDDAVTADGAIGINNSYIFAEWFRPQLDGFGSGKVLDISSSSWLLGIALEI